MSDELNESQEAAGAQAAATATTPLLSPSVEETPTPDTAAIAAAPSTPNKVSGSPVKASSRPVSAVLNGPAAVVAAVSAPPAISSEYKFVHQRIPPREGKLRFFLPILLLSFQVLFIVLFAVFGSYSTGPLEKTKDSNQYAMFSDLHAITLLGFGFLMTFLKRYGYGSVGFNLLLVAFVIQWALILRGWLECHPQRTGHFKIGLKNLVNADLTAVTVLISFGALLGKATLSQLVSMAIVESVVQIFNEYLNQNVIMVRIFCFVLNYLAVAILRIRNFE